MPGAPIPAAPSHAPSGVGPGAIPGASTNQSIPGQDMGAVIAAMNNPYTQVLQGFSNFQAQTQQQKQFAMLMQQAQQGLQRGQLEDQSLTIQNADATQKMAMNGFQLIGNQMLKDPTLQSNPQVLAKLNQYAQTLGIPSPVGPDGKVNTDAFKTPFSDATPAELQDIQTTPPGPWRDAKLARFSNVPDDVRTAALNLTPKMQVELQKANNQGIHFANQDDAAARRASVEEVRAQLLVETNPDRRAQLQSEVRRNDAEAAAATGRAMQSAQQTQILAQEATAGIGTLRANYERYKGSPTLQGQQNLTREYSSAVQKYSRAKDAFAGADAAYAQAFSSGADEDTVLKPLRDKRAQLYAQYIAAHSTLEEIHGYLQSGSGQGAALNRGMGTTRVNIAGVQNLPPVPELLDSTATGTTSDEPLSQIDTTHLPQGFIKGKLPNGQTVYGTGQAGSPVYDSSGNLLPPGSY